MADYGEIDFTPPAGVRAAFKRGLELHADGRSGDGLVPATVAWAMRLAGGTAVTPEKARKGRAWHARHAVDKRDGWGTPGSETPGYVAFMLWGGAPGRAWFTKLVRQMDAADAQESTVKTPFSRPKPLTEATVNIPDGTSIVAWLHEVEEAAIKAVAAVLPPAVANERGRYPEQWARMVDPKPDQVVICVSRWGGPEDSFETYFRLPLATAEGGTFTLGEPVEIEAEYRLVYTDKEPEEDTPPEAEPMDESAQIGSALAGLRRQTEGSVDLAESLLAKVSGKHPLAPDLALALAAARLRK